MQIGSASRQLAGQVDPYPIRTADDAHQLPFGLHGAASNATPLGNVLYALNSFLGHLHNKVSPRSSEPDASLRRPEDWGG